MLLSPFDRLIHDRERTESMFGFRYRLEIYVPAAKREYGYFVLPILDGDALIGRLNPRFDRERDVLRIDGVWAEPDAPKDAGPRVASSIAELAAWLGARDMELAGPLPRAWARAITSAISGNRPRRKKGSPATPARRRS